MSKFYRWLHQVPDPVYSKPTPEQEKEDLKKHGLVRVPNESDQDYVKRREEVRKINEKHDIINLP